MLNQDAQTLQIAFAVAFGRLGAVNLFPSVKQLECENRQPVEDQARRLGVQFGARSGQVLLAEKVQQKDVALLG